MTDNNCEFLQQRVRNALPPKVQIEFQNTLRIYSTKALITDYNLSVLNRTGDPVMRIQAQHNYFITKRGSEENAKNLPVELLLSKESRMIITSNILTQFGLVNGILDIISNFYAVRFY